MPKAVSFPRHACDRHVAHGQLLFPIEPPELLQVHDYPLPIRHDVNAPVTETTALGRHGPHSLTDMPVIGPNAADVPPII
jgi:hypothetical protein